MAKSKKLRWTPKQKEIAALAGQGKGAEEIVAAGHTRSQVFAVLKALKEEKGAGDKARTQVKERTPSNPPPGDKPDPLQQTRYRIDSSDLVHLGGLDAFPEDWRMSQYCIFLMLDTYYRTKEDMGYTGTMGQFLLDMTRLNRLLMQFDVRKEVGPVLLEKEVSDDGRGEEADGGAGVPVSGGGEDYEDSEREG